jgi:hypothetical protein
MLRCADHGARERRKSIAQAHALRFSLVPAPCHARRVKVPVLPMVKSAYWKFTTGCLSRWRGDAGRLEVILKYSGRWANDAYHGSISQDIGAGSAPVESRKPYADHESAEPAPDIQEQILFLGWETAERHGICEQRIRRMSALLLWSDQRARWAALKSSSGNRG